MSSRLVPRRLAEDARAGARLLLGLRRTLRPPIGLDEAHAILHRRLARRDTDFLVLTRAAIFANPRSPYRRLLALAGCEEGDLGRLVGDTGLDGALRTLWRHGVYLTVDEFKGRRPVVRGSASFELHPSQLRPPHIVGHLLAQTGGSRSEGTIVPIDLGNIRDRAVNRRIQMDARGGGGWVHALWGVPGGQTMITALEFGALGAPPTRWFTTVDAAAPGLHPRYRWSARVLHWGSRLAGVPLPALEFVPPAQPLRIVRWMAEVLRGGATPHVYTPTSTAVALALTARAAGIPLAGARFTVGSEPVTEARMASLRDVGAEAISGYGTIEAGRVGFGCLAPAASDDVHILRDLVAAIQADTDGPARGLPPDALLITSLRPTAPLVLLNVSLGDQAVVAERACGCPMAAAGWPTHLHTIRSFEKLTLGGMTFLDTEVVRVLDEVLPARFGGGPTAYQLVEEDDGGGQPVLRLLVHPRVGALDASAIAEVFLQAIGQGSGVGRVMALHWRESGWPRVERRPPLTTPSGKILHLHQASTARRGDARTHDAPPIMGR